MRDRRSYLKVKTSAVQRYLQWHYLTSVTNHIRVTEFPKSGGTWLCQMLSSLLDLPFPRNKLMSWRNGIFHSHYANWEGGPKTILLVRDGRDVIVSAYYHFIIGHDRNPSFLTAKWRKQLGVVDYEEVEKHLPAFIDLFFTRFRIGGRGMNWANYIDSFDLSSPDLHVVKYEDLLRDGLGTLRGVISYIEKDSITDHQLHAVLETYSFKNITGRVAGQEDSSQFLRKGIAGDWKNKFSKEAMDRFYKWAKPQLELLGYE